MAEIEDGFKTNTLVHAKQNAGNGPKAFLRYVCSPPDSRIMVPISAYDKAPNVAITPQPAHTTSSIPTDPESDATVLADAKIPEPIMVPMMSDIPPKRPTVRLVVTAIFEVIAGRHPCLSAAGETWLVDTRSAVLLASCGS